jgi:hypothetical protein
MKQPDLHVPELQYWPPEQDAPSSAFDQVEDEIAGLQTWHALAELVKPAG